MYLKKFLVFLAGLLAHSFCSGEFLRSNGSHLLYGNTTVFLSGANIAWYNYGRDFGNNGYNGVSGQELEMYVSRISAAGGNCIRLWLHCEGEYSPWFNDWGLVLGTDIQGTMIPSLSKFLDFCREKNVFVIIVLWNGALMRFDNLLNLFWDPVKFDSYIAKVLKPMVSALKDKPALAAWEIMNEPEGSIRIEGNSNPCFDTNPLYGSGAGWTGRSIPMELMAMFVGNQAACIHEEDPKSLVTIGSWSERVQTDAFPSMYNYYKDSCLTQASGSPVGKLDFYQIHSYAHGYQWSEYSPFKILASQFYLDKPVLIGEFSKSCAAGENIQQLFYHAYQNDYCGALSWQYNGQGDCSDDSTTQDQGFQYLRDYIDDIEL